MEMRLGIDRLQKRIAEIRAFDLGKVTRGTVPELTALSAAIAAALAKTFGEDTAEHRRFLAEKDLNWSPIVYFAGMNISTADYRKGVKGKLDRSEALLTEAVRSLEEDLAEQSEMAESREPDTSLPHGHSRRVFVVHGHNEAMLANVARFLEKLRFEPIILHEQASQGRTIIEKIERHSEVGFAMVLLSDDDVGGKNKDQLRPRARQNVVLELGYFLALLKRERVCALKFGDVEVPSDFAGVVYVEYDTGGGWKAAVIKELIAAGFEVDGGDIVRA
jgi:predicted nucleotide-binding protein